ncbi:MAG TPA: tetratricopeptide repeat protein [Polyangia bacterium]|nr:tetratricopeptide repeat protein [Polyangia bacterium]
MTRSRSLLLLGMSVAAAVSSPAAAQTLPSTQADFSRGQALMIAKKPVDAAEKFEAVTKAEPDYAPGWYALGSARRRANQCDLAVPAYRRYAQMMPDEPEPYYGLGLCLKQEGQLASAAQALRRYVDLEKRPSSQKWVEHAQSVIEEIGNGVDAPSSKIAPVAPPEAKGPAPASSETSLAAESPAAPIYARSQQLRDTGHIDESIAQFKEAIAADPKQMLPRAALGELLLKVRRDTEAIEVFRAALKVNPEYPLAWYELAFAFRVRGRLPEAVDAYEHYIKLRPTDPDPYYGLARSLQKLGKKDAARKAYETYVDMEKRPTEQKWIDAAATELRSLGGTR